MAANNNPSDRSSRSVLAYGILIFSALALTALAVVAIVVNRENAITIVNIVLPVITSWVGTILAFYFGRENFEAANQQVRELVRRLTPEERASAPIKSIMRRLTDMVYVKIPPGKGDRDIKLSELCAKFGGNVSRLPIIDADEKAKYIIHESSIDKYIVLKGKNEEDTLAKFITSQKEAGFEFGLNKGFVVVSEEATIAAAKHRMEEISSCQDIFVTRGGSPNEPLTGWISNVRMAKFLEA
ncbi:MAG: hypothetical protein AB4426_04715 [Xenococcaceae cyanobacterium]